MDVDPDMLGMGVKAFPRFQCRLGLCADHFDILMCMKIWE
jgi:hypothetical protein